MERGFVVICGSSSHLEEGSPEKQEAEEAARQLGLALAEADFGIIVYSSKSEFIEKYIVDGYLEKDVLPAGAIRCRLASGEVSDFDLKQHPGEVIKEERAFSKQWDAPFFASFSEAAGMLIFGGGGTTRTSGLVAISMRLPICVVGQFGGEAARLVDEIQHARGDLPHTDAMIQRMQDPVWSEALVHGLVHDLVVLADQRSEAQRQVQINQETCVRLQKELDESKQLDGLTAKSTHCFAGLLVLWLGLIVGTVSADNGNIPSAAMPLACTLFLIGGMTGGAWTSMQEPLRHGLKRTVLTGGAGGFLLTLLYVLPQWLDAKSVQVASPGLTSPLVLQLVLGSVTAFAIGAGGDHAVRRLIQRGDATVGSQGGSSSS